MLKTEEEAGDIRCCVFNKTCESSQCMAWRWGFDARGDTAYSKAPIDGQPGHFDNAPMGYCGLAGKPGESDDR